MNEELIDAHILRFVQNHTRIEVDSKAYEALTHMVHQVVEQESKHWRETAIYLADCHAANAQGIGQTKSCSKYNRKRFAGICETAEAALAGITPRRVGVQSTQQQQEDVKQRCRDARCSLADMS